MRPLAVFLFGSLCSAQSVKLNAPLPSGRDVLAYQLGPGARALYVADARGDENFELFVVPTDGSQLAVPLSTGMVAGGDVQGFTFLPGGTHALYFADGSTNDRYSFYSVPLDASAPPLALTPTTEATISFTPPLLTNDGAWLVYATARTFGAPYELYSVPTDGSGPDRKLNGPPPGRIVLQRATPNQFAIDAGGRVLFRAQQELNGRFDLYEVPLDRSTPPLRISPTLAPSGDVLAFRLGPDGRRILFTGEPTRDRRVELLTMTDAHSPASVLSASMIPLGDVSKFDFDPLGTRAFYYADAEVETRVELYSVPADGSGVAVKLNGPLAARTYVYDHISSPDSARVVFRTRRRSHVEYWIYSVPADGSAPAVLLNAPQRDLFVSSYIVSRDSTRVVFTADADTPYVAELYSVPIDGSLPPVKLNGPLVVPYGNVYYGQSHSGLASNRPVLHFPPGNSRVLFHASAFVAGEYEIFSAPLDGSAGPVIVNAPHLVGGPYEAQLLGGTHVTYLGFQDTPGVAELYSIPLP